MEILDSQRFPIHGATSLVANGRQISFEELRISPNLFAKFIEEKNPQLDVKIKRARRNHSGAVAAKNALDDPTEVEKMSIIVQQTKLQLEDLMAEAENWAAHELEKESSSNHQTLQTEESTELPSSTQIQHLSTTSKTELIYRGIAQAILLSGQTNIIEIARQTGFSLSTVQTTLRSAEFQSFLNIASEHAPPPAIVSNNGRLRELMKQYQQIERIILERSLAASSPSVVSDQDLIELGLSPAIRDPLLARIPGASQGLITKIPVVSRVMGGEGRGGRSEVVYNYQFDSSIQATRERLIKEIRTEMAEAGVVSKAVRKTYGFDTEGI